MKAFFSSTLKTETVLQREKIDTCSFLENMQSLFTVHSVHGAGLTTCLLEGRAKKKDQLNSFT